MTWRCTACNRETESPFSALKPTLDPNIRVGYCLTCKKQRMWKAHSGGSPIARNTDPDTSHEAAASVRNPGLDREKVYAALGEGPMTDEEILERCHAHYATTISPSGARTRRAELVKEGRVVDTGNRKRLHTGRRAIVWARA